MPTVTLNGQTWEVELATTDGTRHRGLGGRESLPKGRGMLFIFREPRDLSFWMLDCRMDIDIAYIRADGTVIRTYTMKAQPGAAEADLKLYPSLEPAQYALEVAAGELSRAGVAPGQKAQLSPSIDPRIAQ